MLSFNILGKGAKEPKKHSVSSFVNEWWSPPAQVSISLEIILIQMVFPPAFDHLVWPRKRLPYHKNDWRYRAINNLLCSRYWTHYAKLAGVTYDSSPNVSRQTLTDINRTGIQIGRGHQKMEFNELCSLHLSNRKISNWNVLSPLDMGNKECDLPRSSSPPSCVWHNWLSNSSRLWGLALKNLLSWTWRPCFAVVHSLSGYHHIGDSWPAMTTSSPSCFDDSCSAMCCIQTQCVSPVHSPYEYRLYPASLRVGGKSATGQRLNPCLGNV